MKGLPPTLTFRRGSGIAARVWSVWGSSRTSNGRSSPTQTVTMRPAESKVIEPHSWPGGKYVEGSAPSPSGPGTR